MCSLSSVGGAQPADTVGPLGAAAVGAALRRRRWRKPAVVERAGRVQGFRCGEEPEQHSLRGVERPLEFQRVYATAPLTPMSWCGRGGPALGLTGLAISTTTASTGSSASPKQRGDSGVRTAYRPITASICSTGKLVIVPCVCRLRSTPLSPSRYQLAVHLSVTIMV